MKPLVLQGSLMARTLVLRRFMDDTSKDSSILLLSLEQSPSGMNLVCARNVLLVHPMYAKNREEAINFEKQAIGRCVRQGQKRKVNIYRFVTKDTVEAEITQRHHADIFQAAIAEGERRSLANQVDAAEASRGAPPAALEGDHVVPGVGGSSSSSGSSGQKAEA